MKTCPSCRRQFIDSQEACPLDDAVLGVTDGKLPRALGRELGSYRLVCLLGEGGMGSIYIGAHTRLNRYVAIKVLRKELQHRREHIARFFDEARTVNRIKHPNIVESIDLVEDVVDGAYCVLELLHGPDLKTLLRNGALSLDSAVHIGAQIADALAAVHSIDIVHRDLKPENLILIKRAGRDDFVKLIDFGVAQISDEGATGLPFGTAAYMAPEQAAGERVDGRADVYSLGVLLYEMVTGEHPYPSTTDSEFLLRHADDPIPRPSKIVPAIPRALEAVIMRCLAKSPDARFPTAAAVATALRASDVRKQRSGSWKWLAATGVIAAAATAAAIFVLPGLLGHEPHAAEPRPQPVAPAVVAKPADAAAKPPQEVTITFTSMPAGAQVFRVGETVPLGTTPFATTFPRSAQPSRVRFELPGHEPAQRDVELADSHESSATLAETPEPAVRGERDPAGRTPNVDKPRPTETKPKSKQVQREGTMDPFAPN